MAHTVTVKKVFRATGDSKKTGKPWTRFDIIDTNETRYKTFNFQLGQQAENAEGKTIGIEFHTEQDGQYANNILDSIDLNGHQIPDSTLLPNNGHAVYSKETFPGIDPEVAQQLVNTGKAAYFSDLENKPERPIRSHETNRSDALGHALKHLSPDATPQQIYQVADAHLKYIEQGSQAFGQF